MNSAANPSICCSDSVSDTDNIRVEGGSQRLSLMSRVTIWTIGVYQGTRILRAPSCRFYPSCSQYMADSMRRFGFIRGLVLGLVRLAKCHPWHQGGIDDVPRNFSIGNR